MTLRLTDELTEALRDAAAADGRSMQQTAALAIERYVAERRHTAAVTALATEAAAEYPETLRRLGE
ncbi:MAG: CopG family transcriptional regulator [Nakamurella sp.]